MSSTPKLEYCSRSISISALLVTTRLSTMVNRMPSSVKFDFSRIQKFTNLEDAEKWLHTEEYDFRTRELMSKSAAIAFAGKEAVDYAETNFGNATEPAVPQKHRKNQIEID